MTPKAQRIGIAVIAVVMFVGTLGSFAMLVLANNNALKDQENAAQAQQELMNRQAAQKEKYQPIFAEYKDNPATFDAGKVGDEVTFKDLKKGEGETIAKDSAFRAYYIGWNPKGVMFDSSFQGDELGEPLTYVGDDIWEFPGGQRGGVIEGWGKGMEGMKIGGVRELTIPSDLAYGEQDRGENIPPNTPLKFIIMVIPADE